jgi:hypothetical protein
MANRVVNVGPTELLEVVMCQMSEATAPFKQRVSAE